MTFTTRATLVIGAVLATLALLLVRDDGVQCPTEDSCVADYHDGAWHITPTVP